MPLFDHFHPPLSERRKWEGFHSAWASAISETLNAECLPDGYFAEPQVRWGSLVEVDVAAKDERWLDASVEQPLARATREAATALAWSPPDPVTVYEIDLARLDDVSVKIYQSDAASELVAAIELVSPNNKDRPEHRRAFAGKIAGYLQSLHGAIVVDIVTGSAVSLHAELFDLLAVDAGDADRAPPPLAVAYRALTRSAGGTLESWLTPCRVGDPLPTLPLWIAFETAVPVDFERSYDKAAANIRFPGV